MDQKAIDFPSSPNHFHPSFIDLPSILTIPSRPLHEEGWPSSVPSETVSQMSDAKLEGFLVWPVELDSKPLPHNHAGILDDQHTAKHDDPSRRQDNSATMAVHTKAIIEVNQCLYFENKRQNALLRHVYLKTRGQDRAPRLTYIAILCTHIFSLLAINAPYRVWLEWMMGVLKFTPAFCDAASLVWTLWLFVKVYHTIMTRLSKALVSLVLALSALSLMEFICSEITSASNTNEPPRSFINAVYSAAQLIPILTSSTMYIIVFIIETPVCELADILAAASDPTNQA